jgi:hypothetical protein
MNLGPAPIHVTFRWLAGNTLDLSLCQRDYRMSDRARAYILDQCQALMIPYIGQAVVMIGGAPDLTLHSRIVYEHLQEAQRLGWLQYHRHTNTWGVYL